MKIKYCYPLFQKKKKNYNKKIFFYIHDILNYNIFWNFFSHYYITNFH